MTHYLTDPFLRSSFQKLCSPLFATCPGKIAIDPFVRFKGAHHSLYRRIVISVRAVDEERHPAHHFDFFRRGPLNRFAVLRD